MIRPLRKRNRDAERDAEIQGLLEDLASDACDCWPDSGICYVCRARELLGLPSLWDEDDA